MKLSELRAEVEELQAQQEALHAELHAHLDNMDMPAKAHREKEREIRSAVRAVMDALFPRKTLLAKAGKMFNGKNLVEGEVAEYERAVELVGTVEIG